jgi:hypothetical protein
MQGAAPELFWAVQQHPAVDVGVIAQGLDTAHDDAVGAAPQAEGQPPIGAAGDGVAVHITKAR